MSDEPSMRQKIEAHMAERLDYRYRRRRDGAQVMWTIASILWAFIAMVAVAADVGWMFGAAIAISAICLIVSYHEPKE